MRRDASRKCRKQDMIDARDKAAATKRTAVRPGLRKRSPDLLGL
jgi:hypothetical protein